MTASKKRFARMAMVPLLLVSLGACATTGFKADVSRFQSQLPAPQGQTFAVVADDPALAGGLEFSLYADLVEEQMARLGYVQGSPESANLLVRFDYGVDKGRERVRSTGFVDPYYGAWGRYRPYYRSPFRTRSRFGYRGFRGSRAWGFGFYDPWFGGPEVRSYTVYTSGVDMKIDNAADGSRLFEGKAEAVSTSNRLQYLVPNLVEAMFTDFPGNSGETLRISIKPEETKVRRVN
ncbi:DUF4136 domain-containing protein [Pontixanthobacter sp. CEM42]|uniref:DUF4136 domain-containing protein n=1 Tax=Pontixanthobacter sp. CEM42 TaxID=2792077 RepID=UPI001ADED776